MACNACAKKLMAGNETQKNLQAQDGFTMEALGFVELRLWMLALGFIFA